MSVDKYPFVQNELATIQKILDDGASLARFGDGECKLMDGSSQIREPASEWLAAELRDTIADPDPQLLIGVPTMDPNGPKIRNWEVRKARFLPHLSPDVRYYSAFVSRPDSAPWISTQEYANKVVDIWRNKRATIIAENHSKLLTVLRKTCDKLSHVECPSHQASKYIKDYHAHVMHGRSDIVVLSCGPAATVLSRRIMKSGRQCIDLGSIGGFLLKMLDMEPLGDLRTVVLKRPDYMTVDEMKAKLLSDWEMRFFDDKER